jgi:hypothetical protein
MNGSCFEGFFALSNVFFGDNVRSFSAWKPEKCVTISIADA